MRGDSTLVSTYTRDDKGYTGNIIVIWIWRGNKHRKCIMCAVGHWLKPMTEVVYLSRKTRANRNDAFKPVNHAF